MSSDPAGPVVIPIDVSEKVQQEPPGPTLMKDATSKSSPTERKRILMQPQPLAEGHPFVGTLRKWQEGIDVNCGKEWSWESIVTAVERGPHRSALTPESLALFEKDVAYQVEAGFCEITSWDDVCATRPRQLKISPVAVVPQRNRRGRIILDLSFPVR